MEFTVKPKGSASYETTIYTTNIGPMTSWSFGATIDTVKLESPNAAIWLKGGDTLKIWTTTWGNIDWMKLSRDPF